MRAMEATQMAAWPQDEQNEIGDEELGRILKARRRGSEERLAHMEAQHRQLSADIERERQHMAHVDALLSDLGLTPPVMQGIPATSPNGTMTNRPTGENFTAGNRSDKMPPRRSEYAAMSLTNAAKQLLASGRTMDLDELTHAIYDIQNGKEELPLAKGSLRSTMAGGVGKFWSRAAPGKFRLNRMEGE